MYEQLSKELKASLFQRIKSPFFGSFLIGLFIFNYRFLFILLSDKSLEEKFKLIDTSNLIMNITPWNINIPFTQFTFIIEPFYLSTLIYPFLFALFYIGIVPFFEYYISMPIWKKHQNRLKEKYAKLEGEEIFLGKEKSKYLDEILNLKKEKNKLVEELTDIDLANQSKLDNVKKEKDEEYKIEKEKLNADFEIRLKDKDEELKKIYEQEINNNKTIIKELENNIKNINEEKINAYIETIDFHKKTVEELKIKNNDLISENDKYKNELENNTLKYNEKISKYLEIYSEEELKYLEVINKYNIPDNILYSEYINKMTTSSGLERNTIEYISENFVEKGLIEKNSNYIYFHKNLKRLIYEIFVNSKSNEIYIPIVEEEIPY